MPKPALIVNILVPLSIFAVLISACGVPIAPLSISIPTDSPVATEEPAPTATSPGKPLRITILYNNIPSDTRLTTDWGFSSLVEYGGQTVLFDAGGDGRILLHNMEILAIDPARIQSVVLSHAHSDHTGGLAAFLEVASRPCVYLLPSFSDTYAEQLRQSAEIIDVMPGQSIAEDVLSTGEIRGDIPEQALVIRTSQGLVIMTGCAHPGIVQIIEGVLELIGEPIHLVLGGFHLVDHSDAEIAAIIADFRRLGVQMVAPSHCTGERAIAMFESEYGEDFLHTGVGSVITIER